MRTYFITVHGLYHQEKDRDRDACYQTVSSITTSSLYNETSVGRKKDVSGKVHTVSRED
jgi:hypothetical protein